MAQPPLLPLTIQSFGRPHNPDPREVTQLVQIRPDKPLPPLKAIFIPAEFPKAFKRAADSLSEDEKAAIAENINSPEWIEKNANDFIKSQFARIQPFIIAAQNNIKLTPASQIIKSSPSVRRRKKEITFMTEAFITSRGEPIARPKLHTDPFTIHLSLGTPLQFLAGDNGSHHDKNDPNIYDAQQGDIIVFDRSFPHRSSCHAQENGQFSIAFYEK